MLYHKLVGKSIDTNHVKIDVIATEEDAVKAIKQVIAVYTEGMLDRIRSAKSGRDFSANIKTGTTLREFLVVEKRIDFDDFSVLLSPHSLHYIFGDAKVMIPTEFDIEWDPIEIGGRIKIAFKDRWGSEMLFIHFEPSNLKGMFEFIGKGYGILQKYL